MQIKADSKVAAPEPLCRTSGTFWAGSGRGVGERKAGSGQMWPTPTDALAKVRWKQCEMQKRLFGRGLGALWRG